MSLFALLFLTAAHSWAYDCSSVKPFSPQGTQEVIVTVSRFKWDQGQPAYEDVCKETVTITWYDVRSRETEAYYCLRPQLPEIVICDTFLGKDPAEIEVLPVSWIRSWQPRPIREYRFHAFVVKKNDPNYYLDIFSRTLLFDLTSQDVTVEGSLKTGPNNPEDGFWIRTEFQK